MRYLLNMLNAWRGRGARRAAGATGKLVRVLALSADNARAWYDKGNALRALANPQRAISCYRRALELDPRHDDARFNLATTLLALERPAEAEVLLRQLAPAVDVLQNLAIALARQERYAEAEPCLHAALARGAPSVALLRDLALVLHRLSRNAEASATLERALALEPGNAQLHAELGELRYQRGEFARARGHFEQALARGPGNRDALIGIGRIELLHGNIRAGWAGYRSIMRGALVAQNAGLTLDHALPADLTGKTVLLLGEQGIGDELTFLRYVPALTRRGATVYYRAENGIGALLHPRNTGIERVHALNEQALPRCDCTLLSGDLPLALATNDIPPPLPLAAQPQRIAALRARLAALGAPPYIGLTWRAGIATDATHTARLPLPLFKQIALPQLAAVVQRVPGTLLALQRQPRAGEVVQLAALIQRPVHDFAAANEDLEDMLALLTALDDYVGVSNTNMHLMASLGKTARVLMPCPPDWRWLASGKESPWFPGFAIYRQNGDGDWSPALQELQRDLGNR